MAGKKKVSGEIDTSDEEVKDVGAEQTEKTSVKSDTESQLQEALAKANQLIAQLETANQKVKDAGEKKDNTKPVPLTKESFLRYIAFLKDKKPKVFEKKFEELKRKGEKFGVSFTLSYLYNY